MGDENLADNANPGTKCFFTMCCVHVLCVPSPSPSRVNTVMASIVNELAACLSEASTITQKEKGGQAGGGGGIPR